jgi:hypothetical protein
VAAVVVTVVAAGSAVVAMTRVTAAASGNPTASRHDAKAMTGSPPIAFGLFGPRRHSGDGSSTLPTPTVRPFASAYSAG